MVDAISRILQVEGTDRNPRSSAVGPGQFINSTWLNMIQKYRPELAQGRSPQQILALRTDPNYAQLGPEMTAAYARENQGILAGAGLPTTPGNTYLAHFAGPGGAIKLLSADPNTPVSQILPGAVSANPFLANMTAKDAINWAERKMAGTPALIAPQNTTPQFAAGESPALGTPPVPPTPQAATSIAQAPAGAPAAAPGGLGGMIMRALGIAPAAAPAAGVTGIPPQAPPQFAPSSIPPEYLQLAAEAKAQQEAQMVAPPAPLQMPEFDQLQFAGQRPLKLAPPQAKFGRGFY